MPEHHRAYLGLGANLGDRQTNILQALQYVQARASTTAVSSFHETEPVGYSDQPRFLNICCAVETDLPPQELLRFLKWIEKRMGRVDTFRNAPRPIDIDILFYDDRVVEVDGLQIPHPRLHQRAFVLVPLVEIAPQLEHPLLHRTAEEMLREVDRSGVKRVERSLRLRLEHDVQAAEPAVGIGLSRVGVTNLRRVIQIVDGGREIPPSAILNLFVDLNPEQAGVHMSRFSGVLESLIEELGLEPSPDIESIAERLAQQIVETLDSFAPVRRVDGFAEVAKEAAQGAALIGEGLAGGRNEELVETMRLREARGTALDHLYLAGSDALRQEYSVG